MRGSVHSARRAAFPTLDSKRVSEIRRLDVLIVIVTPNNRADANIRKGKNHGPAMVMIAIAKMWSKHKAPRGVTSCSKGPVDVPAVRVAGKQRPCSFSSDRDAADFKVQNYWPDFSEIPA